MEVQTLAGQCSANYTIQEAIQLSEDASYAIFDLPLLDGQKELLESLEVSSPQQQYVNYGQFKNLPEELSSYFSSLSPNNKDKALEAGYIVSHIIKTITKVKGFDSAFITVRSRSETELVFPEWNNNEFITRWHCDGNFYINTTGDQVSYRADQVKFNFVLKGMGTLLYEPESEERA